MFWTSIPHAALAAAGIVALRFGPPARRWLSVLVGAANLAYVAFVYGPMALRAHPPEGGLEFLVAPLFMWVIAAIGSLVCGMPVYRSTAYRRTVH
ncbi:MAG: hypothetical protein AAFN13_14615 [Bacteroidota bacterium]